VHYIQSEKLRRSHTLATAGHGVIELTQIAGKTHITRRRAHSPLKLLSPRTSGNSAWIFTSTYGGGLLGGDAIHLDLHAGSGTRCLLSTQASTKIYRTTGAPSRQELHAQIDPDAILVSAPDPIVCFAGANFSQAQRFDLSQAASLVLIDSFTSGRKARGERWAFARYASRTEIFIEDRCVFRDAILLDPTDGPLASPMRMGACDCFATIVIAGAPLQKYVNELAKFISNQQISRDPLFSASCFENGIVIRIAAIEIETVVSWIRERLNFVTELLEQDPWSRKC